jgi:DNA polymerase-3 subunit gamma/tau
MSLALYRKYRSRSLAEIVGQDHVTTLLANAIKSDKVAHAYLFTGPKGVGKTSIARILAHEINGLDYDDDSTNLDIIEIDAASNNGVEDIRDLRDRVQIAPVSAKRKIYIIDEVHMLSKAAFNALLKTLEEPPEHVVFILATTDIDKVPETIISRTQRHSFRRASEPDIIRNLKRIASHEGVNADDAALELVAKHSDGSFRDSVSLFDQLISGADDKKITAAHVIASLGLVSDDVIKDIMSAVESGDIASINRLLRALEDEGVPPRTTASQLADHLRRGLGAHPEFTSLINDLLDVSRSHYPELKLLTALSLFASPTPHHVSIPAGPALPATSRTTQRSKTAPKAPPKTGDTQNAATNTPSEATAPSRVITPASGPFEWDAFVGHVRSHYVALHSVLSKCEPELDGSTLLLYTKSAFYKKKLDDAKYKSLLSSSLHELGYDFEIETIATAKPLKDSQAARVAAIMGGGEEVSVESA